MQGLIRRLRSPRLAIALILLLVVYVAIVSAVPQVAEQPEKHAEWVGHGGAWVTLATALGLHRAYVNPFFLLISMLLTSSTAACAWVRTRRSLDLARGRAVVDGLVRSGLEQRPSLDITAPGERDVVTAAVSSAVSSAGFRVKRGPRVWYAERHAAGLLGSPVFHWSLVALVVVIGAGQLTRWHGLVGIDAGGAVFDRAESYRVIDAGPLGLPHTDWSIAVPSVDDSFMMNGVNYGVVPVVEIRAGERLVAGRVVHANKPLKSGPLLVHLSEHGLAVSMELTDGEGELTGASTALLEFDESSKSGTAPYRFNVNGADGSVIASVSVEVEARAQDGRLPRLLPPAAKVRFVIDRPDGSREVTVSQAGGALSFEQGRRLSVREVDYYVRLSVVRDWSVLWVYALLSIAAVGAAVALLMPFETGWIRFDEDDGAVRVRVFSPGARRGSAGGLRLLAALQEALDSQPEREGLKDEE